MIAQHSLQGMVVSEPTHRRHPVARLLGPLHIARHLPARHVAPILLATVTVLVGVRWPPPGIVWGNGSTSIQTPLPPPAPTAGKAAWIRFYRSYDLVTMSGAVATIHAPATALTIAVVREPVPQPRALRVGPTRTVSAPAPTPMATPRPIPAEQTR